MTKRSGLLALSVGLFAIQGCEDASPTSSDGNLLPVDAVTVELRLSFSEFASDFQLFSGLGSTARLSSLVLAHEWEGEVEGRALFGFPDLPDFVFVFPPGENVTVRDSTFIPVSGDVALEMDTLDVRGALPVPLEAGVIDTPWDPASTNWDLTVDTLGAQLPWPEPGAGPVIARGQGEWDPTADAGGGDEEEAPQTTRVELALDSAGVTALVDRTDGERTIRVTSVQPGSRLGVRDAELLVRVRSSINPDTIVTIVLPSTSSAFVQNLSPTPNLGTFPIGGAPATRATFRLDFPESVEGTPDVCALVSCPIELLPERLIYAGLELRTAPMVPAGLRPLEETVIELRPALNAATLPRSPLGSPLACPTGECSLTLPSTTVEEVFFTEEVGTVLDMPMTRYVRDFLRGDESSGAVVPSTLVLLNGLDPLTGLEMRALQYSSFGAPGTELEPTLRLILTLADGVPAP